MGVGPPGPLAVLLALQGSIEVPVSLLVLGFGAWVGGEYADRTRRREAPIDESDQLKEFLRMNPEERFDLEAITSLDFRVLYEEARRDRKLLSDVMQTVQALFPRILSETEDAGLAGSFLRSKTLDWYRRSPSEPNWTEKMAVRWGGIFHESRTAGGRLSPKLTSRLSNLHLECAKASGVLSSFTGGLHRGMTVIKSYRRGSKRPSHSIMLQVCQAFLDDLSANPRNAERPFPLEKLSELSRRIGAADVNMTLGELFPQPGGGPFTVLDPRFHLDMDALVIKVEQPKGAGDAGTYAMVHTKSAGGLDAVGTSAASAAKPSPWGRDDFSKDEWHELLEKLDERSERLEPPPIENHRKRKPYLGLRQLILTHPAARKAFRSVHWKGKPSGLGLVCRLLSDGTFVPDVETDADYLEAELGHIANGNADGRPNDGKWDIGHGWKIVREVSPGNGRTYRAERVSFD